MLTYLICPSVQNFFRRKQALVYREGLTGKFSPNRFLKTRFFLAGFLLYIVLMYF